MATDASKRPAALDDFCGLSLLDDIIGSSYGKVKEGFEASITVSLGELRMIYPLTIAPKITVPRSPRGKVTRADIDNYLKKSVAFKSSAPDLNRDGRRDYRDDYILTANYLVGNKKD